MIKRLSSIFVSLIVGLMSANLYAAYRADLASKHSPKFATFSSKNINTAVKRLEASEAANAGSTYPLSNFTFLCPGYSFLTGISSKFEIFDSKKKNESSDRSFSVRCSFFEDQKKRLIRKANCNAGSPPSQPQGGDLDSTMSENLERKFDHEPGKPGVSLCSRPDVFLAGLSSQRYRQVKDSSEEEQKKAKQKGQNDSSPIFTQDRAIESTCCQLNDFDGQNLIADSCVKKSFKANSSFDFNCTKGKMIHEIRTEFFDKDRFWDRSYTFTCCAAVSS